MGYDKRLYMVGLKNNNMRQNIQIKILKNSGKTIVTNYVTNLDLNPSDTTVNQKAAIKSSISNVDLFEVEDEILWWGSKKLKDDELVQLKSGLEYNLIVK